MHAAMAGSDLKALLRRAHDSLTCAINCVDTDHEAAVDDMVAARLLIATALLTVGPGASLIG